MISSPAPRLTVAGSPEAVQHRLVTRLCEDLHALQHEGAAHLVLTGGRTGAAVLEQLACHPGSTMVDWSRVHVWWGDERFVPLDSAERNDALAVGVFREGLKVPSAHLHRFPGPEEHPDLAQAVAQAELTLWREYWPNAHRAVAMVGVGPDGHVASLFPSRIATHSTSLAVGVTSSPKPPAKRLSFSLTALNAAHSLLVATWGSGVAEPLAQAWPAARAAVPAPLMQALPVGLLRGRRSTTWFVDRDAAAKITAAKITA